MWSCGVSLLLLCVLLVCCERCVMCVCCGLLFVVCVLWLFVCVVRWFVFMLCFVSVECECCCVGVLFLCDTL